MIKAAGLALVAASSFAALSGCGTAVDNKDLESKLSSYLQLEYGRKPDVACPSGKSGSKGDIISCTASVPGGKRVTVRVRIEDSHGGASVVSITPAH